MKISQLPPALYVRARRTRSIKHIVCVSLAIRLNGDYIVLCISIKPILTILTSWCSFSFCFIFCHQKYTAAADRKNSENCYEIRIVKFLVAKYIAAEVNVCGKFLWIRKVDELVSKSKMIWGHVADVDDNDSQPAQRASDRNCDVCVWVWAHSSVYECWFYRDIRPREIMCMHNGWRTWLNN